MSVAAAHQEVVDAWPARGALAWRAEPAPLSDAQQLMFVATLRRYESEVSAG